MLHGALCDGLVSGADYLPSYRIYFGKESRKIYLLLCGGDKSTQSKDIKQAQEYWNDHKQNSKS